MKVVSRLYCLWMRWVALDCERESVCVCEGRCVACTHPSTVSAVQSICAPVRLLLDVEKDRNGKAEGTKQKGTERKETHWK